MDLAQLTSDLEALAAETAAALPAGVAAANPVALRPMATPEAYRQAVVAVGRDPGVDALVVIYVPPLVTRPAERGWWTRSRRLM